MHSKRYGTHAARARRGPEPGRPRRLCALPQRARRLRPRHPLPAPRPALPPPRTAEASPAATPRGNGAKARVGVLPEVVGALAGLRSGCVWRASSLRCCRGTPQPRAQCNWRRENANASSRAQPPARHRYSASLAALRAHLQWRRRAGRGGGDRLVHHRVRLVVFAGCSPGTRHAFIETLRLQQKHRHTDQTHTHHTSTEFKNDFLASMRTGFESLAVPLTKSFQYTGFVT